MSKDQPVIIQIIPELGTGGAEQGTIDVAAELVRAGSKAIVISQGGSRVHELKRIGAIHIDLPVASKNPLTIWQNIKRIEDVIEEHDVDIVHVRSRAPAWSAYYACKNTETKFVTTFHAPYNISGKFKRMYNAIMAKGDRVIAISGHVEKYIHNNYVVDPDKVRLIHRGVAIEKFHPTMVTPQRLINLAQEWRIPDGAPVIMLPARITRWKGHLEFLEALRQLNRKDVFAIIVGPDQGRKKFREEVDQAIIDKGLAKQIRIVGNCNDMPAAYMLTNVVVSASIEPEGFGRIPIEAQAMGRPVVATNHGGAAETIIHGETGWHVTPGDPTDMARAMAVILSLSEHDRAVLATKAMHHVSNHFTKDIMCDKTLDVYAELLHEKYGSPAIADQRSAAAE
ncbi:MAG: glycosyl transferase [Micavibrio sp.]|nr:glycosyl transferase [Micavibrio sp.]|tara:strand:+ start:1204 stop:2391 length:1188 start_codon:yes stop_codon:yes gene_type:complete